MIEKVKKEGSATLTLENKDNGMVRMKYDSKISPMDFTCKLNEEFEYTILGMPDKYKVLEC